METNNNWTLEIWKLDHNGQLTQDWPYFTMPFVADYSPQEDEGDNDELLALETQVKRLAHENRPAIDCAGYRAICRDADGGEHLPIDKMY